MQLTCPAHTCPPQGHQKKHESCQKDDTISGDPYVYHPIHDSVKEPLLRGPRRLHVVEHAIVNVLAQRRYEAQRLGAQRCQRVQLVGFLDEALERALVKDAWVGRGLGNRVLSVIGQADTLIHVVDVSGSADAEGNIAEPSSVNPIQDVIDIEVEI